MIKRTYFCSWQSYKDNQLTTGSFTVTTKSWFHNPEKVYKICIEQSNIYTSSNAAIVGINKI